MITAVPTSGTRRLEQLYEVSKLFNGFASIDDTVGRALQVVAATLPLESALLIHATAACPTEITVWRCEDTAPAHLRAARAHAEAAYAYLVGARSIDTLDLQDRVGSATLPAPRRRRAPNKHPRRFIMMPLVVARGAVFGALQLEAASELDRDDLEFASALTNQLAIALDRERTWRHRDMLRREAQLSRARYENIVDRLEAAFAWEADLESHRISYVSARFESMLGFSRSECLDDRSWWRSHVHPEDRRLLEFTFAHALVEDGDHRCDHRVFAADNAIRWLRTSIHLIEGLGEPPRFQGLSYDITAAKLEQQRVRAQLSLTSAVMNHAGEATLAVDRDGSIAFINDAGARLLGCGGDDALGKRIVEIARVANRAGEVLECPLALAMRTGARVRSDDHVIIRADSSRFRASYTAAAIRCDDCVTGAVISILEIAARGDDERLLVDAGTALAPVLESAEVARAIARLGVHQLGEICVVDLVAADGQPRRVAWAHRDPAAQGELDRLLGGTQQAQAPSTEVRNMVAILRPRVVSISTGTRSSVAELAAVQPLGIRSMLIVPFTRGMHCLGALTLGWLDDCPPADRTVELAEQLARRCALAVENARLYDQVRRAVAVREQALATVSRELKSPLAAIATASQTLGHDELGRDRRARSVAVAKIQRATGRMQRLVDELVDFANIEAGGAGLVTRSEDVATIIADSTQSFERIAAVRGVRLVADLPVTMPLIRCDRDRVLQVIANLLGNALRVVNHGGAVHLRVKPRDNEAVFSVADTGPGITLAEHPHLFEPYWHNPQTRATGIGLGLAIARGILDGHGGRIWADSEPGHGATFFFTIPFAVAH